MNETKPTAETLIETLGRMTVDEIAELMRWSKITGIPKNPWACPVALYLAKSTGREVSVGSTVWRYRGQLYLEYCALPSSIQAFIDAFDASAYPELINR